MIDFGSDVIFKEKGHKYIHVKNGKELISTNTLLHLYKNPFDEDGSIIKKCAAKEGITVKELQKRWDEIRDNSTAYGTEVHKEIEYYIKKKKVRKSPYIEAVKQFSKIKFNGQLFSETRIWDLDLGINGVAGTVDIIDLYNDNCINLADLKTNKKISKFSYGKKMFYPLDCFDDSNFYLYQCQLSLYAYILDRAGYWVNKLTILHYDKEKKTLTPYEVNNVKKEIINMINHYKNGGSNKKQDIFDDF